MTYHLSNAQGIVDVAPSGRQNERAVEGGSRAVAIETNVPLQTLIQHLEGNWELVETFKGYWIGYTDDMYSIASHGEKAVDPLLKFIHNTSSDHAHEGALLTLHLIGIKSRIAGRFYEEFKSNPVREAFYGLLEDVRLRDKVLLLLVRDPWPSDVPYIMKVLALEGDPDCRQTVNALFRYKLPCPAFGGTLAGGASNACVFTIEGKRTRQIGQLVVFTDEQPNEDGERINHLNSADTNIVIQWHSNNAGRKVWKFKDTSAARKNFTPYFQGRDICEITYAALLKDDFVFRYCDLSDPFNYQVSGTNVYIIDPSSARERWLAWWRKQSDDYKDTFKNIGPSTAPNRASRSY